MDGAVVNESAAADIAEDQGTFRQLFGLYDLVATEFTLEAFAARLETFCATVVAVIFGLCHAPHLFSVPFDEGNTRMPHTRNCSYDTRP